MKNDRKTKNENDNQGKDKKLIYEKKWKVSSNKIED